MVQAIGNTKASSSQCRIDTQADFEGGYKFTYKRVNPEEKDNYFVDVYRFKGQFTEADVKPQEAETDGFKLASADEIAELGKAGEFLHR